MILHCLCLCVWSAWLVWSIGYGCMDISWLANNWDPHMRLCTKHRCKLSPKEVYNQIFKTYQVFVLKLWRLNPRALQLIFLPLR